MSPDGEYVYLGIASSDGSSDESGIVIWKRAAATGLLDFVDAVFEDEGFDGIGEPQAMVFSPDGAHLYVTGVDRGPGITGGELAVLSRDASTGALSLVQTLNENDTEGLDAPVSAAVSPDGAHVYVGVVTNVVMSVPVVATLIFSRDATTGVLSLVSTADNLVSIVLSADGLFAYGTGTDPVTSERALYALTRSPSTGLLTILEAHVNGQGGVVGLGDSSDLSPDGAHLYVTSRVEDAIVAFARNGSTGLLTFVEVEFDGANGVRALDDAAHPQVSPDGEHVYVVNDREGVVVVFRRDQTTGELEYVEGQFEADLLLSGKRLVIRNKVPDRPERNKVK